MTGKQPPPDSDVSEIPSDRPAAPRHRRARFWLWLPLVLLLGWGGYEVWRAWPKLVARLPGREAPAAEELLPVRLAALEAAVEHLQREQRQLAQRLGESQGAQQILREELFGVRDRATLLEEALERSQARLLRADQALRLDEAELLLRLGQQRLQLAQDLGAALEAFTLADAALAALDGADFVTLRQTLAQELAALRAIPADPAARAAGDLDALEAALPLLPVGGPAEAGERAESGLDRLLGRVVSVRRVDGEVLLGHLERDAGLTALRLHIVLARLALVRRDVAAWSQAVEGIASWLPRLYPDSPERAHWQARLHTLRALPLALDLPVLGSTLVQLQQLRRAAMPRSGP